MGTLTLEQAENVVARLTSMGYGASVMDNYLGRGMLAGHDETVGLYVEVSAPTALIGYAFAEAGVPLSAVPRRQAPHGFGVVYY